MALSLPDGSNKSSILTIAYGIPGDPHDLELR